MRGRNVGHIFDVKICDCNVLTMVIEHLLTSGKSHKIINSGSLSKIDYEEDLESILKVAVAVNISDIKVCNAVSNPELLLRPTSKRYDVHSFHRYSISIPIHCDDCTC